MTRHRCNTPEACVAGKRGPCRKCSDLSSHAERMRKLHAYKRGYEIPHGAEKDVAKWRRSGLSKDQIIAALATFQSREASE